MYVIKRNGNREAFDENKIINAILKAFEACDYEIDRDVVRHMCKDLSIWKDISIEEIQDQVEELLHDYDYSNVAKAYILYREKRRTIREFVKSKEDFINKYKQSSNTANATVDDNSNVANKNIAVLNSELYKENNIEVNRYRVMKKLEELHPDFDSSQYVKDLNNHIIYKNDENSTFGFPYCVSVSMYPFLTDGIRSMGGLSASPKNIDSFCGMFVNFIFAVSSQFAGAVATSEFLLYFDYFSRKEWGDDYYKNTDSQLNCLAGRPKTIRSQIHQYFQQVVYSVNQPAAARGYQSAFWNISYFDRPFFESMFGNFYFPDGTQPTWESLEWLQKEFMVWFNEERLKCVITFPVESFALIYKDGEFEDQASADWVAEMYSQGHSFFTYISDTADSLASCCRLKNKLQTKEFNFTNGNIGIQTGSKSVITLNLNRIIQDFMGKETPLNAVKSVWNKKVYLMDKSDQFRDIHNEFKQYLIGILERVYKYHEAYNELLWDMYDANLLPVYKSGFIDLNKQYLTIGLNGLTASAEFLGIECNDNKDYQEYCQLIFSTIRDCNRAHKTKKLNFNCELIPAESAGAKLYNWDKQDGYIVPSDINLYTSYIFKPYDEFVSVLDKFVLHGNNYIGEYLDGGVANHVNLDSHLSKNQYKMLLEHAAKVGCQYFTFNIPNAECDECGFITKVPIAKCPKCGSTKISLWDRIIGYLSKIKNWSDPRKIEQKQRVYHGTEISC